MNEVDKFVANVQSKLPDGPDSFDPMMILAVIEAIMAVIDDCNQNRINRYHRGVQAKRWMWVQLAKSQIRRASNCDDKLANAVTEAFGELPTSTVENL